MAENKSLSRCGLQGFCKAFIKKNYCFFGNCAIIPSLTVDRRKNRCSPCIYWTTAIFTVVTDYSNLFLSLTFFLNRPHFTFGYELIVCPETTGVMKIICDRFPSI